MNNSYITIIKEKRTALSRKRVPLNQNECTDDFRIGVPFEQNLQQRLLAYQLQLNGYDMDKNVITRIETNKRYVTDVELKALTEIFNVSYEYLIEGTEEKS